MKSNKTIVSGASMADGIEREQLTAGKKRWRQGLHAQVEGEARLREGQKPEASASPPGFGNL